MTEKFNAEFIPGGAAQKMIRVTHVAKEITKTGIEAVVFTQSRVKSLTPLHFD